MRAGGSVGASAKPQARCRAPPVLGRLWAGGASGTQPNPHPSAPQPPPSPPSRNLPAAPWTPGPRPPRGCAPLALTGRPPTAALGPAPGRTFPGARCPLLLVTCPSPDSRREFHPQLRNVRQPDGHSGLIPSTPDPRKRTAGWAGPGAAGSTVSGSQPATDFFVPSPLAPLPLPEKGAPGSQNGRDCSLANTPAAASRPRGLPRVLRLLCLSFPSCKLA